MRNLLLMISVSIFIYFCALLWPMIALVWGRNLSPRNKHIHKTVLVVTGDFLDLYIFEHTHGVPNSDVSQLCPFPGLGV